MSPKITIHHIGGWGKTVRGRLAPTLGGRLASHAHYLKEGIFWKKYAMSLNLNHRRYYNDNNVLAWCITLYSITNVQRTMTSIMMGKYYIKTDVNVKNGIFQHPSASRRAAFETSIRQMVVQYHSVYSVNVRGSFTMSTGEGTVLHRGPSGPRLP